MRNLFLFFLLVFWFIDSNGQEKLNATFLKRQINHYKRPFYINTKRKVKIEFHFYIFQYYAQYHSKTLVSLIENFTDNVYLPRIYSRNYGYGIVISSDSTFRLVVGPISKDNKTGSILPNMGYKLVLSYIIRNNRIELLEAYNAHLN